MTASVGLCGGLAAGESQPPQSALAAKIGTQFDTVFNSQLPAIGQVEQHLAAARLTPAARAAQAASRRAFRDLDRAGALAADEAAFPELTGSPWRASLLPGGGKVERYLSASSALVSFPGTNRRAVMESIAPLVGDTPQGQSAPADSALESVVGGFAPVSSPVGLQVPGSASGMLRAAGSPIGIGVQGAADSTGQLVAGRAWYPSALPDTDLTWAATPQGAGELSLLLRSPASPHTITLAVDLPAGASVQPTGPLDVIPAPAGSLEITEGGGRLGLIDPASAVDAQGRSIPVTYTVTASDTVAMHLAVPGGAAFPIAVDPTFVIQSYPATGQGTEAGACWNEWSLYGRNTPGYIPIVSPFGGAPEPLFIFAGGNTNPYPAGSFGDCVRNPPANAFDWAVLESNTSLVQSSYPGAIGLGGLFNPVTGTYQAGTYTNITNPAAPITGSDMGYAVLVTYSSTSQPQSTEYCAAATSVCTLPPSGSVPDGTAAFFALGAYTSMYVAPTAPSPPYTVMGTASVYLSDDHAPTITQDTETPALPTTWVKSVSATTALSATDLGLGMSQLAVSGPGIRDQNGQTTGLTSTSSCTGTTASPCLLAPTPLQASIQWHTTAATPDGIDTITDTATDIVGNATPSTHQIMIDNTPPVFGTPSGSLDGQTLSQPVGQLVVPATDATSGVASVSASVDCTEPNGTFPTPIGTTTQTNQANGAGLTGMFTMNAFACTRGMHTITVTALDRAGNQATTTVSFDNEPQAGDTSGFDYLSQPLDDRMGLSENIGTGALSLTASDVDIAGTAGMDLDVTRTYNAMAYPRLNAQATADAQDLSPGWRLSIGPDVHLSGAGFPAPGAPTGSLRYYDETGATYVFTPAGSAYKAPPGLPANLTKSANGTFTLKFFLTGEVQTFAAPVPASGPAPLQSDADRNGNTITINYTPATCGTSTGCEVSTIQGTQGQVLTFSYYATGQLKTISDTTGRTWAYTYDANGNLYTYTDPNQGVTVYHYDLTTDLLTNVQDPKGTTTNLVYDGDGSHRISTVTEPDQAPTGPPTGPQVTQFTYPSAGLQTNVTDPNGAATTYQLDPQGRVTQITDPLGVIEPQGWNASGQPTLSTDSATGATTSTTYDSTGYLQLSNKEQSGAVSTFTYNNPSQPYLPDTATDTQNHKLYLGYNTAGNLTSVSDQPNGAGNRPVNLILGSDGTLSQSTDGDGNITTYTVVGGQLMATHPPAPLVGSTFTYDSAGRLYTSTDGAGRTTTYTYDPLDRLASETFTDGTPADTQAVTYKYDLNGNLLTTTDPSGTTTSTYDQANRLSTQTLPGQAAQTYGYDADNDLASLNDGLYDIETFTYDAADRLYQVILNNQAGQTYTYAHNYDALANGTQLLHSQVITYPNGITGTTTYSNGQVTDIKYAGTAGTLNDLQYTYNNGTTPTDLIQTVTNQAGQQTTYSYDTFNRLSEARTAHTGSLVSDYQYGYDAAGNRSTEAQTVNGTTTNTTYAYNAANELASATTGTQTPRTFRYDTAGDQLTDSTGNTATYNVQNQTTGFTTGLLDLNALTPTYHGAGQTQRTTASSTVAYANSGIGLTSSNNTTTTVNILGLQVQVGSPDNTETGQTTYVRDPYGNLLGLTTAVPIIGIGGIQIGTTTTNYTYATDIQGSTAAIYDNNQQLATAYTYDPYGDLVTNTPDNVIQPYRFQGQYQDSTGLYDIGQRYYDPTTGRWLQMDPLDNLTDAAQSNAYAFAANDPTNEVDPAGESAAKRQLVKFLACLAILGVTYNCDGDDGSLEPKNFTPQSVLVGSGPPPQKRRPTAGRSKPPATRVTAPAAVVKRPPVVVPPPVTVVPVVY